MCGIVAVVSSGEPVSEHVLLAATETLHHRGPETRRIWLSRDRSTGLGHARLSIIDLDTGAQPLSNADESLHLVVNGEFYDFERIRGEMENAGHRLKTRSDSEIALPLYERYGAQCLHSLRGEFAFALWDERHRTLFAARDRFGIKPLYYAVHRGTFYMASEIKALLAMGVPAEWDEAAFYQMSHFVTHTADPEKTLFKGIYQVPPGHYLLFEPGQNVRLYRYWDIDMATAERLNATDADDQTYIDRLREVLEESVRLRMRADVPVGCYLSGGLDSCTALGLAARYTPQRMQAFTLSFDHADYDERAIAEEMAAFAGADFHPIPIRQRDLADHFSDAVRQSETLFFNAHGVAKYLLSRAVRDAGFKVVLTGEGSDENFAGYPHFRRDMLLYNAQGQDPAEVRRMLAELQETNRLSSGFLMPHGDVTDLSALKNLLGFTPSWLEAYASSGTKLRALLSDDFTAQFAGQDPYRCLMNRVDVQGRLAGRDPVNQSLYLWAKLPLPQYLLNVLGDRMEMAHSIEGRVPFLDHHLVELVAAMPIHLKIRGMTEKYALREAARPFITDTVYRRQKHPFVSPPSSLSENDGKQASSATAANAMDALIQDTLRGSRMKALPFFDAARVADLLDRLPSMDIAARTAYDTVLMMMLSACFLQERLMDARPAADPALSLARSV